MPQEIWKAWVVQGAAESNSEIFSLDGMIGIWLEPVCVCYKLMLHIVITTIYLIFANFQQEPFCTAGASSEQNSFDHCN